MIIPDNLEKIGCDCDDKKENTEVMYNYYKWVKNLNCRKHIVQL